MTKKRRVFGRRRFTDRDGVAMTIEMREDGVWVKRLHPVAPGAPCRSTSSPPSPRSSWISSTRFRRSRHNHQHRPAAAVTVRVQSRARSMRHRHPEMTAVIDRSQFTPNPDPLPMSQPDSLHARALPQVNRPGQIKVDRSVNMQ